MHLQNWSFAKLATLDYFSEGSDAFLSSFISLCFDFCYHKFIGRRHEENGEVKKVPEIELKQGNFDSFWRESRFRPTWTSLTKFLHIFGFTFLASLHNLQSILSNLGRLGQG